MVIVSGPSGAGKSVLVTRVLQSLSHLRFSVSYTTRAPRGTERNGVEYCFVDRPKFQSLIRENELLEWAEVHGNCYGTSKKFVDDLLEQGEDVILDIDIQGAHIIRQKRSDAIGVFILPPSYTVLKERLRQRRLDDNAAIERRLKMACDEIRHYKEYDFLITNENLDNSVQELQSIILSARCRVENRMESAKSILISFGGINAEDP